MSATINPAVSKGLLILSLLFWAVCATLWLTKLTTSEDCSQLLLARNLRKVAVENTQANASERTPTEPTTPSVMEESTMMTKDDEFNKVISHYWSQIDQPRHDQKENCTLVMQTYKREAILPRVLKHYCRIPLLQRILVVWNDVGTPVSQTLQNLTHSCGAELMFILSSENKLTNRYLPRSEIETDCKSRYG